MKTTFIYALCEPGTRTVRYIGKANDPKKRLRGHLRYNSIRTETHLGRWLRSLVSAGKTPELVILAEISREAWQKAEIYYIQSARALGLNLTNGTDGGDGVTMTSETRANISTTTTGVPKSPEHRAAISFGKTGVRQSPKHRASNSASKKGVPVSPETRVARAGKKRGPYRRRVL